MYRSQEVTVGDKLVSKQPREVRPRDDQRAKPFIRRRLRCDERLATTRRRIG